MGSSTGFRFNLSEEGVAEQPRSATVCEEDMGWVAYKKAGDVGRRSCTMTGLRCSNKLRAARVRLRALCLVLCLW